MQQWKDVLSHIQPGDFVLIQFAQRSSSPGSVDRAFDSLPGISDDIREIEIASTPSRVTVVHTFGWYLRQYAVESIAHGATPILASPIPYAGNARTSDADLAWSRAIAVQQRIPFVDLSLTSDPASGRSTATGGATHGIPADVSISQGMVAGLKGLPSNPLGGYFSLEGNAIQAIPPPGPPALTAPPL